MRLMTKWEPKKELEVMRNRLFPWFDRWPWRPEMEEENLTALADWAPTVDVTEDEKEYVIKADLPGVTKEEVKVTVEDGILTLAGERKSEKEEKGKKFHRVERTYGSFLRTFTLPEGVESAKVEAEFKDGVLKVRLPKSETAKPKAVEVKVE